MPFIGRGGSSPLSDTNGDLACDKAKQHLTRRIAAAWLGSDVLTNTIRGYLVPHVCPTLPHVCPTEAAEYVQPPGGIPARPCSYVITLWRPIADSPIRHPAAGQASNVGVAGRLPRRAYGGQKGADMSAQHYETLAEASERTGISRNTLRRRIASGDLPAYMTGRRILRLRPEDVDHLLQPRYHHQIAV